MKINIEIEVPDNFESRLDMNGIIEREIKKDRWLWSPLLPLGFKLFAFGDLVQKKSGSQWQGKVVGFYSTELTPEGYAVESDTHKGSVQIYPANALELLIAQANPHTHTP